LTVLVNATTLSQAADKATTVGEGIALNLARLLNEIELQAPAFKGMAGNRFQQNMQGIGEDLRKILDALDTMAGCIRTNNDQYTATDADAEAEISQVTSQYLPGNRDVINALKG
jgi:WXG100 family type VII secretion target